MWELALPAIVTGVIGWMVKNLLDAIRDYSADSHRWRADISKRIDVINGSLVCVMRGDLIHKAHRYVDDKGYASIEEKESWHEEWVQYQSICPRNGFIDALAEQVMALPEHPTSS